MAVDFMILGAQKAATTSLQHYLRAVPGIYMPTGESAFFEDPDYSRTPWERFPMDVDGFVMAGIKRPDTLCRDVLIDRVSAALPEARFIVVLREPIARAISAHFHLMRHAHLPVTSLDQGLRRALREHSHTQEDTISNSLIRFGLYGRYLSRWFDRYPADRFLVLAQTFVAGSPEAAIRRCCDHLGVPYEGLHAGEAASENIGMYDERYIRLHRLGHLLKTRAVGSEGRRGPSGSAIARALGVGLTKTARLLADDRRRKLRLADDTRGHLADVYRADLELLRRVVASEAIDWSFSDDPGEV